MTKPRSPKRKRTGSEIEARVLSKCARRCCLCFYLERDFTEKKGQIAHLDKDRTNASEDNLVYLCLPHHSDYDSKTSQHKNYTAEELRAARAQLHERIDSTTAATRRYGSEHESVAAGSLHGAAHRVVRLAMEAMRDEHKRLIADWQAISEELDDVNRALRVHLEAQNWGEVENNQRRLELLLNRVTEIVEHQFLVEQEMFRL